MTAQETLLALSGLYLITGMIALAELDVTPGSVRRHYENVAVTDPETASLLREHPVLCSASHVFVYLIGLLAWPLVVWAMARRKKDQS